MAGKHSVSGMARPKQRAVFIILFHLTRLVGRPGMAAFLRLMQWRAHAAAAKAARAGSFVDQSAVAYDVGLS